MSGICALTRRCSGRREGPTRERIMPSAASFGGANSPTRSRKKPSALSGRCVSIVSSPQPFHRRIPRTPSDASHIRAKRSAPKLSRPGLSLLDAIASSPRRISKDVGSERRRIADDRPPPTTLSTSNAISRQLKLTTCYAPRGVARGARPSRRRRPVALLARQRDRACLMRPGSRDPRRRSRGRLWRTGHVDPKWNFTLHSGSTAVDLVSGLDFVP